MWEIWWEWISAISTLCPHFFVTSQWLKSKQYQICMILTFLGSNFPNVKIWPFKIGENSKFKFGHNDKSRHFWGQKVLKMEILNPPFCPKKLTFLKNCLHFSHCTSLWLLQSPLPRLYYPLHSLQNGPHAHLPLNLRPPTKKSVSSFWDVIHPKKRMTNNLLLLHNTYVLPNQNHQKKRVYRINTKMLFQNWLLLSFCQ